MARYKPDPLVPLKNVPITAVIDGVEISGTILWLYPNDIEVEYKGRRNGLHVPYFSMDAAHRLATTEDCVATGLTDRGRQHAERLLAELAGFQHLPPIPIPVREPAQQRSMAATPVRRTTLREFLNRSHP